MEFLNKITDPKPQDYYSDIYSPGDTKEALQVGVEVRDKKIVSGEFDTSDIAIPKVDNIYTLSIENPDGKIFSLGIDGQEHTFKIGFFNNTSLAYEVLITEIIDWLGSDYIVSYTSGTNISISKWNKTSIQYSTPNLVRKVSISGFNIYTRITITVDGVDVLLDGATHSGNIGTAIDYLITQLSSSLYYMNNESSSLIIARKDGNIPVITQTQYNSYKVGQYKYDTPNSGQNWDYTNTTIGVGTFYTNGSKGRPFYGDRILRNIAGFTTTNVNTGSMIDTISENTFRGVRILVNTTGTLKSITIVSGVTATRAILQDNSGTQLATATISLGVATFNYPVTQGTYYRIGVDSSGAYYTTKYQGNWTGTTINAEYCDYVSGIGLFSIYSIDIEAKMDLTGYTILGKEFNKSTGGNDSTWTIGNGSAYYDRYHYLYLIKNDYGTISINSVNTYTNPGSFPNDSYGFIVSNIGILTTSTVTGYTEITKTLTLASNNFYIPTYSYPRKVEIIAKSSVGDSSGIYELRSQKCISKYGTTTEIVNGKIFKTNASNYGEVVEVKPGGIILSWTTTTSHKINYICTS